MILLLPCPDCGDTDRFACPWCRGEVCVMCADSIGADDDCVFHDCGHEVNWHTGEKVHPQYMRCPKCMEDVLTILRGGVRRCAWCETVAVPR